MTNHRNISTDEELKDNERMEQAILSLQQNPTQEMLAHALTVVRRRMQAHGQLIVAVEPSVGNQQMRLQAIQTDDGKKWWAAFTSFDEELKGGGSVMSTFLTDMEKLYIYENYIRKGISYSQIMEEFHCSESTIKCIKRKFSKKS